MTAVANRSKGLAKLKLQSNREIKKIDHVILPLHIKYLMLILTKTHPVFYVNDKLPVHLILPTGEFLCVIKAAGLFKIYFLIYYCYQMEL